jgi:hypothetical protein
MPTIAIVRNKTKNMIKTNAPIFSSLIDYVRVGGLKPVESKSRHFRNGACVFLVRANEELFKYAF